MNYFRPDVVRKTAAVNLSWRDQVIFRSRDAYHFSSRENPYRMSQVKGGMAVGMMDCVYHTQLCAWEKWFDSLWEGEKRKTILITPSYNIGFPVTIPSNVTVGKRAESVMHMHMHTTQIMYFIILCCDYQTY